MCTKNAFCLHDILTPGTLFLLTVNTLVSLRIGLEKPQGLIPLSSVAIFRFPKSQYSSISLLFN